MKQHYINFRFFANTSNVRYCSTNQSSTLQKQPTIPPSVHLILQELLTGLTAIHKALFEGLYLTGSIPLNDFWQDKSDIDFLVLCTERPPQDILLQLKSLHATIEKKFPKLPLHGTYITKDCLQLPGALSANILSYHEGQLKASSFEMAPVALYELKTTGIAVQGISAKDLPIDIQTDDLNAFLYQNINSYWTSWIAKHSLLKKRRLLLILFPRLTEWVILGMARLVFTLRTGKIASKTEAGFYVLPSLDSEHRVVVEEAMKTRAEKGHRFLRLKTSYSVRPSAKRARRTLACAKALLALFNNEYQANVNGR